MPPHPAAPERPNRLLPLIGLFKLGKALALFALAYAFRNLRHSNDATRQLVDWIRDVRVDPDSRFIHLLITKLTGIPATKLHALGVGLFLYASLFATEGTGLLLGRRWADYFTVISTSLFLPLEAWELFHPGHRAGKVVLLVANVAIVVYLIWNLRRSRRPAGTASTVQATASATPGRTDGVEVAPINVVPIATGPQSAEPVSAGPVVVDTVNPR